MEVAPRPSPGHSAEQPAPAPTAARYRLEVLGAEVQNITCLNMFKLKKEDVFVDLCCKNDEALKAWWQPELNKSAGTAGMPGEHFL